MNLKQLVEILSKFSPRDYIIFEELIQNLEEASCDAKEEAVKEMAEIFKNYGYEE